MSMELKSLIDRAIEISASDLLLVKEGEEVLAYLRIGGKFELLSGEHWASLAKAETVRNYWKECNMAERSFCQHVIRTGKAQARLTNIPMDKAVNLVMRFQGLVPPAWNEIVPPSYPLKTWITEQKGLCLFVGALGSGKSSAMFSFLRMLGEDGNHIVTVEDPVEYRLKVPGGIATQISLSKEVSMQEAFATVLRSSANAIALGEIRSGEGMSECVQLGAADEPVFATLHAGSFVDGIVRAIGLANRAGDSDTARYLLARCLSVIVWVQMRYENGKPKPLLKSLNVRQAGKELNAAIESGSVREACEAVAAIVKKDAPGVIV